MAASVEDQQIPTVTTETVEVEQMVDEQIVDEQMVDAPTEDQEEAEDSPVVNEDHNQTVDTVTENPSELDTAATENPPEEDQQTLSSDPQQEITIAIPDPPTEDHDNQTVSEPTEEQQHNDVEELEDHNNQMVSEPAEEQQHHDVEELEDHDNQMVSEPTEEQQHHVEHLEDHHIENQAAIDPTEEQVEEPAENHHDHEIHDHDHQNNDDVPIEEHHQQMVSEQIEEHHQQMVSEQTEEHNHHQMVAEQIEEHHLEIATEPIEDHHHHQHHQLLEHHMVDAAEPIEENHHHHHHQHEHEHVEDHHQHHMIAEDHHHNLHRDHHHLQPGVDHMESIHIEEVDNQMVVASGDELAIMAASEENHHQHQHHHEMSTFDEEKLLITPYEDKMLTTTPISYDTNETPNPETQPSKRRKKKSIVWEHFTIETVSAGCRRAQCKQCKQTFAYSTGSKVAGTSHLKRHIAKGTCQDRGLAPFTPASRNPGGTGGSDQPRRRYRTSNAAAPLQPPFDADRCRHEIARMIIMHDYPLHLVEHPGFLAFVKNLQPQFQMVSFNTVQGDCVATYLMEKQKLMKLVEGVQGRFCLSLDMWTSSQSVGYVFVTGYFIDNDWKLQRRLLNVVMEPYPDSDAALSHAVAVCLHDWNLENRLFSITINNPPMVRESVLENLRPLLTVKNPLVLNGQLILPSCLARTFGGIAMEILEEGKDVVSKVRESVKHVKTSETHEEKFLELKNQLQVPSNKSLSVDDKTRWDSTYRMLDAASELKEVFTCLDTADPDYKSSVETAITREDWRRIETLLSYLKLLHDSVQTLNQTPTNAPTPITYFHEVWKIQSELSRASSNGEDTFAASVAQRMQVFVENYWKESSLALAAAVVMDPRFKMKLVEFSFNKIYGDDAPSYIKIVDDGIHELFHEYVALPLPLTPAYSDENKAPEASAGPATLLSGNGLTDFDVYIMETTSQTMKSEIDQYLEESLLPRVHEFDVLGWWRLNKMKYPTLSKMARDVLSVTVMAVSADSVFSAAASGEMDGYRSSLRPETVEALVCAKDWMQYDATEAAENSNAIVRMEY